MNFARSTFLFCVILKLGSADTSGEDENTFAWASTAFRGAQSPSFEESNEIPEGVTTQKHVRPLEGSLGPVKDFVVNLLTTPAPHLVDEPNLLTPIDVLQCVTETKFSNSDNDPDIKRNTKEILEAQGYQVETHEVKTKDGYILTIFRIPRRKNERVPTASKKAVLLNHGLLASSAQWVMQKGNKNLAMKLADAGYDVWLNNHRGTSYSTGHVSLTQNDVKYWDFSWHEMGVYDVPAVIDYMLAVTKHSKIFYVGHSQGTTQFLVAMSEREEYNKKIEVAFLLSPIAYLSNVPQKVKKLGSIGYKMQDQLNSVLGGKFQGNALNKYFNTSIGQVCADTQLTCLVGANIWTLLYGYDAPQIDYPRFDVMLSKYPDSASTKCAVHYAQNMHHLPASFRQFDYLTPAENEKRYGPGITEPPTYNLTKVVAKVIGFYGDNDNLGDPTDVAITMSKLGNTTKQNELVRVNWSLFHHMDFTFAKDADLYVYNYVLEVMNSYK